ncbi:MAG: phosphate/phosphite/phosphonate ABC transporter substrate-binding protein [Scytonematopsis contorta HA4267-MV1]|nr:phosphate/phosphite/phosphonate ABC transporter substrate-binding protein [Scytonematopsis contorta HA4267-MV1]
MTRSKKGLLGVSAGLLALAGLAFGSVGMRAIANPTSTQKEPGLVAQNPPITTLRIVLPSRSDSTDLQNKANRLAAFLSAELKMPVQATVGDDTAAVEALRANRAEISFLNSRGAIKAQKLANARMYLAEVRSNYSGRFTYRSIFVVPKDSPLKTQRGASARVALGQLRGRRIAFTSPTSGSGFIVPVGELVKSGLVPNRDRLGNFFGQVSYGGGYSGALQAVLRGQADVAAVSEYTLGAPYITAEEAQRLRILYSISGVPAHGIVIDDRVSGQMRNRIIAALLKLNQSKNNSLLRDLYNSTELVPVNHDTHVKPMLEALQRAGIEP